MKPGDLRVGNSYTWLKNKTLMIVDVKDDAYEVQPIVVFLLSDGRLSRDTYDYIKHHTVPLEKTL